MTSKKKSKSKSRSKSKKTKSKKSSVPVLPVSTNGRCEPTKGGFVYYLELDRISDVKAVKGAAELLRANLSITAVGIWEDDSEKKVNLSDRTASVTQLFTSWVAVVAGTKSSKVRAVVDPSAKKKDLPRFELALTFAS